MLGCTLQPALCEPIWYQQLTCKGVYHFFLFPIKTPLRFRPNLKTIEKNPMPEFVSYRKSLARIQQTLVMALELPLTFYLAKSMNDDFRWVSPKVDLGSVTAASILQSERHRRSKIVGKLQD